MERSVVGLVGLLAAVGCGSPSDQVTVEFSSLSALEHTNLLSVTAFEPFIRDPDSDALEFVTCADVSPFPPVQRVNPETISVSNLVGKVLTDRENEAYPLEGDWDLTFDRPDPESESNPWGAMMVYVEARGDARASDRGAGQISATLLSGCYCVRTRDEGFSDPSLSDLDKDVRRECPLIDDPATAGEPRIISLQALSPPEFHLTAQGGNQTLTAPRNGSLEPGPQLKLQVQRCDNVLTPQDCFKCATPSCPEIENKSNVPILVTVEQSGGRASPQSQVVLTNAAGEASASIDVDNCDAPITITSQIVGRPEETVSFDVDCVDPIAGYECIDESALAFGFEAVAITEVPAVGGDLVAVLFENGEDTLLEVRGAGGGPRAELSFPGLRAHTVKGFWLDEEGGTSVVVVVLGTPDANGAVFVYRWENGQLVPHDGATGQLTGPCAWFDSCHSNRACTRNSDCGNSNSDQFCDEGQCRLLPCWPHIQLQSQVTVAARDLDGDGRRDIAIGNSGEHPIAFFVSSAATGTDLYASSGCTCARFGQAPTAFALSNMGGAVPNRRVGDAVLGAQGGTFLMYSQSGPQGPQLSCGQASPLGDGMSARDVQAAKLSCSPDDLACSAYDDTIIISARGISGGSLDEPGFIRVLYGSSTDLSVGGNVLRDNPTLSLGLVPRAFPERSEPRDPRSARVRDYNADGHQDLAVLYKSSEEVHVWLGGSNRALGEIEVGVVLEDCALSLNPGMRCAPLADFAAPDLDGDGRAEIAVICDPMGEQPRLRFFQARAN